MCVLFWLCGCYFTGWVDVAYGHFYKNSSLVWHTLTTLFIYCMPMKVGIVMKVEQHLVVVHSFVKLQ